MAHTIRLLGLPLPPMLEKALGYHGGRTVAFYRDPDKRVLVFNDSAGQCGTGFLHAWVYFINHPMIQPFLKHSFQFGDDHAHATHWLVIHRDKREVSIVAPKTTSLEPARPIAANINACENKLHSGPFLQEMIRWLNGQYGQSRFIREKTEKEVIHLNK